MLRSFVEKTTRRSSFRRALPTQVGGARIYVSGSAGLKYLFRPMESVDPTLCNMAKEFVQSGHVVWDVGANVGLFSFAAAHLAGRSGQVFAFEADLWLVQLLQRSVSIQPSTSGPVQIVPTAVANACDLRVFNIAARSRASNFLAGYGQSQTGGVAERQTVIAVSIDWLAERLPLPDVLKIDVEGAELEVLEGASDLLKRKGPVIICEVSSEHSKRVTDLLKRFGYKIYDADTQRAERRELVTASWNTVAIRD
jgi:FkbM family methyltransferase